MSGLGDDRREERAVLQRQVTGDLLVGAMPTELASLRNRIVLRLLLLLRHLPVERTIDTGLVLLLLLLLALLLVLPLELAPTLRVVCHDTSS